MTRLFLHHNYPDFLGHKRVKNEQKISNKFYPTYKNLKEHQNFY